MYQRGSPWTDFREIWYLGGGVRLNDSVSRKIQFWLKFDKTFAIRTPLYHNAQYFSIAPSNTQLNNTQCSASIEQQLLHEPDTVLKLYVNCLSYSSSLISIGRAETERDGTRAETRFGFPTKRTSPFISAGASVQSAAGSRGVRISGSNAG